MRLLRIPFVVLALVGLIAVAGCGGSDSTDGSSTDALSEDAYAEQVTTIVTSFATSFQALGTEISSANDPAQLSDGLNQAEAGIQGAIDDLDALQPPAGAEQAQEQLIGALEGFSTELSKLGDAVDSGDKNATKAAVAGLQSASLQFQSDLSEAQTSFDDAGITLGPGGTTTDSTDSTTG